MMTKPQRWEICSQESPRNGLGISASNLDDPNGPVFGTRGLIWAQNFRLGRWADRQAREQEELKLSWDPSNDGKVEEKK